jgi:hypothetical protein
MMKVKGVFLILFILNTMFTVSAIDWPENFFAYSLGVDYQFLFRYETSVWKRDDTLFIFRTINKKEYYQKLTLNDLHLQSDGFYELETFGSKLITLFGAHYFFFHDVTQPDYSMFNTKMDYDKFYKENEFLFTRRDIIGWRRRGIIKITVPDVLEELGRNGKIRYDTADMQRYYARGADGWVLANPNGKPWATSKDPIGMTIDIEFNDEVKDIDQGVPIKGGSDYLIILNGYANPLKRHLYKENRRIKCLKIESLGNKDNFTITQNLEDVVRFHVIKFPKVAKKIRLTILDYYEGTKYKDLCVQAFLTDYDMWDDSGDHFLKTAKEWRP